MQQAATAIDYKTLYEQSQAQLEQALGTIALLQHRLEQLEKMIFGSKQERFVASSPPVLAPPSAQREQTQAVCTAGSGKANYLYPPC